MGSKAPVLLLLMVRMVREAWSFWLAFPANSPSRHLWAGMNGTGSSGNVATDVDDCTAMCGRLKEGWDYLLSEAHASTCASSAAPEGEALGAALSVRRTPPHVPPQLRRTRRSVFFVGAAERRRG
jgi:hypothetical protein